MAYINRHEDRNESREVLEEDDTKSTVVEEVHHYHDDVKSYAYPDLKLDRVIWLIAIILEILIGFRVFLKLIAANPQSGFANFVYNNTTPFLTPFAGLTTTPSANGSVLEISSVIAMAVYAILFWITIYVIHLIWDY